MRRLRSLSTLALLAPLASGCVSYAVGTTAETLPKGEVVSASILEVIPPFAPDDGSCDSDGTSGTADPCRRVQPMGSVEIRSGLDERSEIGVRFIGGGAGLVGTYKRRLSPDSARAQQAFIVGAGITSGFQVADLEGTFIVSGRPGGEVTPYGGLKAMLTYPLGPSDPIDLPTVGTFVGARIGRTGITIAPEIGVFFDRSATGGRSSLFIVVPSVTITGIGRSPFGFLGGC